MSLHIKQLPGLFNGVSQQPATLRLPTQAEEVVNCRLSVVDGVSMRPPTEHIATLDIEIDGTAKVHTINRAVDRRHIVVISNGDLKVFDMEGNEKPVEFPSGKGYLANENPRNGFACVTFADFTFIVNKDMLVQMAAVGDDLLQQPSSYWWLNRQATSDSLSGAQQRQYSTNPSGGVFRGSGRSVDYIAENAPDHAEGDIWKVVSSSDNKFTTFYIRRVAGEFTETVAPGIKNLINAATMPHALVELPDGSFGFGPFSWAPRHVGDETTNPNPTFVGRTINDVFFHKNRLCFLSDENVIGSRTGDYGNFYRLTVTDTLADQVIDIGADGDKVSVLNHAVPFNQGVMAFSDQTQFYIGAKNQETTSTSMSADVTTSYPCAKTARPVAIGSDIYFVSESDDYATVWEYFVRDDTVTNDAANITAHVPRYVPAGVTKLTASTDRDLLFALSTRQPSRLYYYQFYWQGDTKAQSAWSYWQYDESDTVLDASILGEFLYVLVQRSTGLFIERQSLQLGAHPVGIPFEVFIDRRTSVQGVYLPFEDKTEFLLPYAPKQSTFRLVKSAAFVDANGELIDPSTYEYPTAHTVKVPGDQSDGIVYAGHKYTQRFTFSEQFVTDSNNVAVNTGRLQLRSFTIYFVNTAYFRTEVDPYGDGSQTEEVEVVPTKIAEFTGKTLGSTGLVVGQPSFAKGKYTFQVYAPAESARVSIVNDTHVGCTIQKAEVEMFYFNRAKVR